MPTHSATIHRQPGTTAWRTQHTNNRIPRTILTRLYLISVYLATTISPTCFSQTVSNFPPPHSHNWTLDYGIYWGQHKIGQAHHQFSPHNVGYCLHTNMQIQHWWFHYRTEEHSEGQWLPTLHKNHRFLSVQPQRYHFLREQNRQLKTFAIDFDWNRQQAHTCITQHRPKQIVQKHTLPLQFGIQDKLSVFLAFAKAYRATITTYQFDVLDGDRFKSYRITVNGKMRIKTPAGLFDTVQVTGEHAGKKTTLWLWEQELTIPVQIQEARIWGASGLFRLEKISWRA